MNNKDNNDKLLPKETLEGFERLAEVLAKIHRRLVLEGVIKKGCYLGDKYEEGNRKLNKVD